ncbi:unnamed protein product [Laminaria digitata]
MVAALQACNPLGLCAGSLPSWCAGLPEEFPSLFSLDVRLALLKKTAFGMARGVAHVQEKAKKVEEDSPIASLLGSGLEASGVAGRGGGGVGGGALTAGAGQGGADSLPLHELLRQLGRLGRLTVCFRSVCLCMCVHYLFKKTRQL